MIGYYPMASMILDTYKNLILDRYFYNQWLPEYLSTSTYFAGLPWTGRSGLPSDRRRRMFGRKLKAGTEQSRDLTHAEDNEAFSYHI